MDNINQFPYVGKRVKRKNGKKWEEGIVVLDSFDDEELEEFIEFSDGTREQLYGLPFELVD